MPGRTIQGAGGIVVRRESGRPLVAVVQRKKDGLWVLPRGKLERKESPLVAAQREAVEETGHRVRVHQYLGAIAYLTRGQTKVVRFWLMQAAARPSYDVMKDIIAVQWLPLAAAVRRLSHPLEKAFLSEIGSHAIRRSQRRVPRSSSKTGVQRTKKAADRVPGANLLQ